jgi:hypothetical protein
MQADAMSVIVALTVTAAWYIPVFKTSGNDSVLLAE